MATIVPLPGGFTALLRNSDELTNKHAKELRRTARKVGLLGQKLKELGIDDVRDVSKDEDASEETKNAASAKAVEIFTHLTDDEDDSLDLFQRSCVIVRLLEWTLDRPLPTTVDEVDDLPRPIYAALTAEAAKVNLGESFGLEDAADPKADIENSDSSGPSSEAVSS